jgi:hypothetical protein
MPMKTETLMEIVKNRANINSNDENNPTTHSFLYELYMALERLKKYEDLMKEIPKDDDNEL